MPRVYTGSYDRWHEDYERGRPGWPSEVLDLPGLAPTATVLDLGAGTGKLTRLLVSRFEGVGVPLARELIQKLRDNEVPIYI